jgi:glutamate carboxypeptidase
MKASLAITLMALKGLISLGLEPVGEVQVLFTPDEEIGSPVSRKLITSLAQESQLVLCMEPAMADGSLKTARKGGMTIQVQTIGRAAHAGADHAAGINAIAEMAHQVLALQALTDYDLGTTVSVGKIEGGTATNIVPPECRAWVDVRVSVPEERERIREIIQNLQLVLPGAGVNFQLSAGRPPMPRDERMAAAFAQAQEIGARWGLALTESSSGGASDANLAAPYEAAILDGLGAVGGGLHAADEYIELSSLPERAMLLAALLTSWQF